LRRALTFRRFKLPARSRQKARGDLLSPRPFHSRTPPCTFTPTPLHMRQFWAVATFLAFLACCGQFMAAPCPTTLRLPGLVDYCSSVHRTGRDLAPNTGTALSPARRPCLPPTPTLQCLGRDRHDAGTQTFFYFAGAARRCFWFGLLPEHLCLPTSAFLTTVCWRILFALAGRRLWLFCSLDAYDSCALVIEDRQMDSTCCDSRALAATLRAWVRTFPVWTGMPPRHPTPTTLPLPLHRYRPAWYCPYCAPQRVVGIDRICHSKSRLYRTSLNVWWIGSRERRKTLRGL